MQVIFVPHFEPKPEGHGGNHRSYQIVEDIVRVVGRSNLIVLSWSNWRREHPSSSISGESTLSYVGTLRRIARSIEPVRKTFRLWRFAKRLSELSVGRSGVVRAFSSPEFADKYQEIIKHIKAPAVSVIEHVGFSDLIPINLRASIPTIACIQNLESLDRHVLLHDYEKRSMYVKFIDFVNEFDALAQCNERLLISKVEAGLISGLGLRSHYYPYVPVGQLRERLKGVRRTRQGGSVEKNLFLMLGSCHHYTTRQSFSWFVRQARQEGLPNGMRVVIGGQGTDQLLPPDLDVPGIELQGWLTQDELDRLLSSVQGVLAPQLIGFGALTRLPELSCAGIPVVASQHSVYAIDPPPGIEVVGPAWDDWYTGIKRMIGSNTLSSPESYRAWERRQCNTLQEVLKNRFVTGSN